MVEKKNVQKIKLNSVIFVISLLFLSLNLLGCEKEETEKKFQDEVNYSGANAEIVMINPELKGFVVKALDSDSVLGEMCYLGLENNEILYMEVDSETGELCELSYEDFSVGDIITLDVNTDKIVDKYTVPYQIQLVTRTEENES